MAKLRATIRPEMSTGYKKETSRLASESIEVTANTWTRHVNATLGADGRLSLSVRDGAYHSDKAILIVELPAQDGEHADAFAAKITFAAGHLSNREIHDLAEIAAAAPDYQRYLIEKALNATRPGWPDIHREMGAEPVAPMHEDQGIDERFEPEI